MNKNYFIAICSILHLIGFSQNALIKVDEPNKDIGLQENIYKIKADYIITNNLAKNLYLMRADATKGITIQTSKKTLKPNDTAIIVVEFIPKQVGKFNETINLITTADGKPFTLSLSGNIKSIKTDDKTACFYFKKPNNAGVKIIEPIVMVENNKPRDSSNKIPDNSSGTIAANKPPINEEYNETVINKVLREPQQPTLKPTQQSNNNQQPKVNNGLLDEILYKPNNIVFLVDVSSSMKDTLKLNVMKEALHHLIAVLRPTDKVTFITYADTVKLLKDGLTGNNKKELNEVVDKLKARGLTKGNKAILYSLDVALKNYIPQGNNQILLTTDGKFRFYSEDQKTYLTKQGDKQIKLSTIAFGNDKPALKNLKEIATIGNGNFVHIKNRNKAKEQLLDEIRENSLIQ